MSINFDDIKIGPKASTYGPLGYYIPSTKQPATHAAVPKETNNSKLSDSLVLSPSSLGINSESVIKPIENTGIEHAKTIIHEHKTEKLLERNLETCRKSKLQRRFSEKREMLDLHLRVLSLEMELRGSMQKKIS
jgi:hypothetical protein